MTEIFDFNKKQEEKNKEKNKEYQDKTFNNCSTIINNVVAALYESGIEPKIKEKFEDDINILLNLLVAIAFRADGKYHFLQPSLNLMADIILHKKE